MLFAAKLVLDTLLLYPKVLVVGFGIFLAESIPPTAKLPPGVVDE